MITKNKRGDIANFLSKTSLNKEIPFSKKGNPKSKYLLFKRKRADIAITILVIAVVVLCTATLFSFYVWGGKIGRTLNSAYALEDTYNLAESIKYSGVSMLGKYNEKGYSVEPKNPEVIIKRTFYKKDFGIVGPGINENEEVLRITYKFVP